MANALRRLIHPREFKVMPWKNGSGTTSEIAVESRDGKMAWRLSIATVASDGPFSLFSGCTRILTVIEGSGLDLIASAQTLHALPLKPVTFSGDDAIVGRLHNGTLRDFNVIFDSSQYRGNASILRKSDIRDLAVPQFGALLFLTDDNRISGQPADKESCAILAEGKLDVELAGPAILITLSSLHA